MDKQRTAFERDTDEIAPTTEPTAEPTAAEMRALWDAVEVLNEAARILDGRYWRIATDHGDTLAAALIALAGKVKEG